MYDIKCDICNSPLEFDYMVTLENYFKDIDYLEQGVDLVVEKVLNNYLVYICNKCKKEYKYTYKEIEQKLRETISWEVMKRKKAKMFSEDINFDIIKPGCGTSYCGQCTGIDDKGNCSNDLIKQCTIRK